MREVLLAVAAILSIALYRMISRGGKNYAYNHTQTIDILPDGTEVVIEKTSDSGTISITNKTVIIDGVEYIYKPLGEEPIQAVLEYKNQTLTHVRVLLPEGEKHFFIQEITVAKGTRNTTLQIA